MAKATDKDLIDFEEAMSELGPTLRKFFSEHTLLGTDPRTVAAALETAAQTARGWCIGRFG